MLKYKGMIIEEKINHDHGTTYYIILNPFKKISATRCHHTHSQTVEKAKKIVDCYSKLRACNHAEGFARTIRNKAMTLAGMKVLY
jgi:predicted transcriptional regulator of viral defense system